jgi:hypothetical protein
VHVGHGRPYAGRLETRSYAADHQPHRVMGKGEIRWRGEAVYVSEALRANVVG